MEKGSPKTHRDDAQAKGVYDYCCASHKYPGMIGRLIVGQPIGPGSLLPGSLLFDRVRGGVDGRDWLEVPAAACAALPSAAEIMTRQVIPGRDT
jgi:hypothetical protein